MKDSSLTARLLKEYHPTTYSSLRRHGVGLCTLFWKVVFSYIAWGIVWTVRAVKALFAVVFVCLLLGSILSPISLLIDPTLVAKDGSLYEFFIVGMVLWASIVIVIVLICLKVLKDEILDKLEARARLKSKSANHEVKKEPNLFWQYLVAKKNKMCPIIHIDEEKVY